MTVTTTRSAAQAPVVAGTPLLGSLPDLLRDPLAPGIYVTLDRWRSDADFQAFLARFGAQYAALDKTCDALTAEETDLGQYEDTGAG